MLVHTDAKSPVPSLAAILADVDKQLKDLKDVWAQRLKENPASFGTVEVDVHQALQQGFELLTTRQRDLELYRAGQMPRGTQLRGKRVGVAIDGGRVRTRVAVRTRKDKRTGQKRRKKFRTEWREPKLLIIFEMDQRGRMVRRSLPWIDRTFQGP